MMMTGGKVFADTNIILRAFHHNLPDHQQVRMFFETFIAENMQIYINLQVIREYLVQATHPRTFTEPLSIESLSNHLQQVTSICTVLDETEDVSLQLMELIKEYPVRSKQIHDANIAATMLVYHIDILLTLNVKDMKRFENRINVLCPQ